MEPRKVTSERLARRKAKALDELHPILRAKVEALCRALSNRVTPWEGYRGQEEQAAALKNGASNAAWGHSPHNFRPSLACDLVLNPAKVAVRAHPRDADFPDLWDDESPEAIETWRELDQLARLAGLVRVTVDGQLDRPHVELPNWRSYLPG